MPRRVDAQNLSAIPVRIDRALALLLVVACGSSPPRADPLDWIAVGVDPAVEAEAVARTLGEAGYRVVRRAHVEGAVALELRAADDRRAIRIVTSRGVVLALDSLAEDGVRERDGPVRLREVDRHDVDSDGAPDLVVEREDTGCLSIVRVSPDGRVSSVVVEAEALALGACATELRDVDGEGGLEAIVILRWPALALGDRAPAVEVPFFAQESAYRYRAPPVSYLTSEREARASALEPVRARRDVAEANRLGVELAALANLGGATFASQAELHDRALSGLVLDAEQLRRIAQVRAFVAAGWRDRP